MARVILFFVVLTALFYIANHGAFQGYFQNDDLDNLGLAHDQLLSRDYFVPAVLPKYYNSNYRSVGHLFYKLMSLTAGMTFPPYIAVIQIIHLINAAILFLLLMSLGFTFWPACAGTLLFAFHMACFDIYWKAMYVFDLLCGTLCLLSILAYVRNRWIVSTILMLLAFHAKEMAIMLPVVFAAFEFLIGGRNWKRLIPSFTLALVLGVQALLANHAREETSYTLHFDPASIWTCIRYYSGSVFLIPFAGLLVLGLFFLRDKRAILGGLTFCALLFPMLVLPGRLFSAYLYVPLIGLAIGMSTIAANLNPAIVAAFFVLWLPWNYSILRKDRRVALSDARDRRAFVAQLTDFVHLKADLHSFIGHPSMPVNTYGTAAVVKLARPPAEPLMYAQVDSPEMKAALQQPSLAILDWDWFKHQLKTAVHRPNLPDTPYISMNSLTPIWQLEQGWYEEDHLYRWTRETATARLNRPDNVHQFELVVTAPEQLFTQVQESHVAVTLDDKPVGEAVFSKPGVQTVRWDVPSGREGPAKVTFRVWPMYHGTRPLGIAVVGFGFRE
jgi:hypothetical protein